MWSPTVIEAPPVVALVDASRNLAGWESEVCDRLFAAFARRGLRMVGEGASRVGEPEALASYGEALATASCVLLVGPGGAAGPPAGAELRDYWDWLRANLAGQKLVAVCSWENHDPALTDDVLKAADGFAPLAVAQQSPVSARAGSLFLIKFFSELHLHSEGQMTGRMVWFSWSKARELLKRRGLEGSFGLRA